MNNLYEIYDASVKHWIRFQLPTGYELVGYDIAGQGTFFLANSDIDELRRRLDLPLNGNSGYVKFRVADVIQGMRSMSMKRIIVEDCMTPQIKIPNIKLPRGYYFCDHRKIQVGELFYSCTNLGGDRYENGVRYTKSDRVVDTIFKAKEEFLGEHWIITTDISKVPMSFQLELMLGEDNV